MNSHGGDWGQPQSLLKSLAIFIKRLIGPLFDVANFLLLSR